MACTLCLTRLFFIRIAVTEACCKHCRISTPGSPCCWLLCRDHHPRVPRLGIHYVGLPEESQAPCLFHAFSQLLLIQRYHGTRRTPGLTGSWPQRMGLNSGAKADRRSVYVVRPSQKRQSDISCRSCASTSLVLPRLTFPLTPISRLQCCHASLAHLCIPLKEGRQRVCLDDGGKLELEVRLSFLLGFTIGGPNENGKWFRRL